MAEEPTNPILEYLGRFDARLERMEGDLQELKLRVGDLETAVVLLHTDLAHQHSVLAQHSNRFDRIEASLTRIEQRLELAPAG
jgi:chromosome segregation ATPase